MIQLATCTRCKGFLALALRACPHCGAPLDRARQAVIAALGVAGGGAVSMTLMACYGPACVDDNASCLGEPDAAGPVYDAHVKADAYVGDGARADAEGTGDAGAFDAALDARPDATDASTDAGADAQTDAADGG